MRIRLGTRGSMLALAQSDWVAGRLRSAGHDVEVVRIVTEGDLRPVDTVPGEGIFVAAIANALKRGEIDVAVHSAKDVPLEEEPDLVIAAYPKRADPRDALVTKSKAQSLANLPANATVGTDSPRRAGFVRAARGDLRIVPLHGNVDTRLRRLDAGEVDALVIAAAGLDRLGRGARIDQRIDPKVITPAPAQGALAIQARRTEGALLEALEKLDEQDVRLAVEAERSVLSATGGTCRAPVGALASMEGERFTMIVGGVNSEGSDLRIEVIEGEYPIMIEEQALRLGSGGDGAHRGGLGFRRAYRVLAPELTLTSMLDRRVIPPYGLAGGRDGAPFRITVNPGERERVIRGKETVRLAANDLVVIETCGGGGYGPPEERSAELQARDRAEGDAS